MSANNSQAGVIGKWRRAVACGDSGGCVELAPSTLGVALRDSKLGDASPVLHFSPAEMRSLFDAAKAGDFDPLRQRAQPDDLPLTASVAVDGQPGR